MLVKIVIITHKLSYFSVVTTYRYNIYRLMTRIRQYVLRFERGYQTMVDDRLQFVKHGRMAARKCRFFEAIGGARLGLAPRSLGIRRAGRIEIDDVDLVVVVIDGRQHARRQRHVELAEHRVDVALVDLLDRTFPGFDRPAVIDVRRRLVVFLVAGEVRDVGKLVGTSQRLDDVGVFEEIGRETSGKERENVEPTSSTNPPLIANVSGIPI